MANQPETSASSNLYPCATVRISRKMEGRKIIQLEKFLDEINRMDRMNWDKIKWDCGTLAGV